MLADASTTCRSASACATTFRNCVPRPLPAKAPLMSPGRSITSIGMNRQPSMHVEFRGLSLTSNSRQTQRVCTWPVPTLGFFVVKGYVDTSAVLEVAALKNVVLPVFVLPTMPMRIMLKLPKYWRALILELMDRFLGPFDRVTRSYRRLHYDTRNSL